MQVNSESLTKDQAPTKEFSHMKEYGSSVQKLVDYILTVEDEEKRTKYAFIMVELMRQIHPGMKDPTQDYSKKLWDDLFIMSNFKLKVEGPYPPPSEESVGRAPKRIAYQQKDLRFKHYGRNVELLIQNAVLETNPEDKKNLVAYVARLMKGFYVTWNKESVDDAVIWQNINELSKNALKSIVEELSQETLGHAKVANNARNAFSTNEFGNGNGRGNGYKKNNNYRRNFRNHKK